MSSLSMDKHAKAEARALDSSCCARRRQTKEHRSTPRGEAAHLRLDLSLPLARRPSSKEVNALMPLSLLGEEDIISGTAIKALCVRNSGVHVPERPVFELDLHLSRTRIPQKLA